jgi:GT2 family glycosyltransferase
VEDNKNLGAAGNRNRIIAALRDRSFADDTIIVFIDADTTLVDQKAIVPAVKELFVKYSDCGMIGGKVLNNDGSWGAFNYGPLSLYPWMYTSFFQVKVENTSKVDPEKAKALAARHADLLKDWPNPFAKPIAKEVGWLVETLVFIKLGIFAEVGGYDPSLRYCEAIDLGRKLKRRNLTRIFDPTLSVKHLQIDNRGWHRNVEVLLAVLRLSITR